MSTLDDFIDHLARTELPFTVFNQYAYGGEAHGIRKAHGMRPNAMRRENLRLYLQQMSRRRPSILLVAEAPGYRGCRLTGIPFVSEQMVYHGLDGIQLFGYSRGYRTSNEWPAIQREASATIMWQVLLSFSSLPLLWNAFPFHPFRMGKPQSNRPPTNRELNMGEAFFRELKRLFPITAVVAVGNKAEAALAAWGIPFTKVRHPSHGGKREFTQGIWQVMQRVQAMRPEVRPPLIATP